MNIDHINISAPLPLLEEVRDFYLAVLGLEEGFRPDFGDTGFWLYSGDEALIHLSEGSGKFGVENRGHLDHVAFRTTGLAAMVQRLETMNIEYRSSYIPDIDMSQLFFFDPAGIRVEVNFLNEPL